MIANDITEQNTPPVDANGNNTQSALRMEKPKITKFSGDVREFAIFKADFKPPWWMHDIVNVIRSLFFEQA